MGFLSYSSVCHSGDVLPDASVSHLDVWVDMLGHLNLCQVSQSENGFFGWQDKLTDLRAKKPPDLSISMLDI